MASQQEGLVLVAPEGAVQAQGHSKDLDFLAAWSLAGP